MDETMVTAPELIRVVDEAGAAFGWSRSYQSLLCTAIGVAFEAAGLDESTDAVSVAPTDVGQLSVSIADMSIALGRAPRTASSYANAFRRLAEIAVRWKEAGGEQAGNDFWDHTDDLRDKRTRRLTEKRPEPSAWRFGPDRQAPRTLRLELSAGVATVAIPDKMSAEDHLALVEAILSFHRSGP